MFGYNMQVDEENINLNELNVHNNDNNIRQTETFNSEEFVSFVDDVINNAYSYNSRSVNHACAYVNKMIRRYEDNNYIAMGVINTFFDRLNETYHELKIKRIELRNELLLCFKEGFNYNNSIIDHECDEYDNFNLDIFVLDPLERQTNDILYEYDDPRICHAEFQLGSIRKLSRYIYTYHVRYINYLICNMNYTRSQVFKYELIIGNKKRSLFEMTHAIDVILNSEFMKYFEIKNELYKWIIRMNDLCVDDTLKFQEQIIDIDTIGKNLLARYYNMLFDVQYGLPCSVIKECVDNKDSELWKKICTQKSILGGTINMPKNYCS